ncbi:unnamed protein product, partial [Cladocopium goreaui]
DMLEEGIGVMASVWMGNPHHSPPVLQLFFADDFADVNGRKRPKLARLLRCLSPIWEPTPHAPEKKDHAVGGEEGRAMMDAEVKLQPGSLQCDAFLRDACGECAGHLEGTELLWLVEPGGKHNERDWGRRLPCALRWLLAPEVPEAAEVFWTRPSPVPSGGAFELLVHKEMLSLPVRERYQVHLGFDNWSSGIQCCNLLPSGLAKEENGSAILAALAYAPPGSASMHFALTNGVEWDNNQEKNYELPVR